MMTLNDRSFHRALKQPRLIVMFTAPWAGPCNLVRPVYTQLESEYPGVTFAEFVVDDNPKIPQQYGVRNLPCFLSFAKGTPVTMKAGAIPEEALRAQLTEMLEEA